MAIQAHLATLERQYQALEQEICEARTHPSCDDLKMAELERRRSLMEDAIAHLRQDVSALVSRLKSRATEKRRAALRIAQRKSSSWYEGATRSISIVRPKTL